MDKPHDKKEPKCCPMVSGELGIYLRESLPHVFLPDQAYWTFNGTRSQRAMGDARRVNSANLVPQRQQVVIKKNSASCQRVILRNRDG